MRRKAWASAREQVTVQADSEREGLLYQIMCKAKMFAEMGDITLAKMKVSTFATRSCFVRTLFGLSASGGP